MNHVKEKGEWPFSRSRFHLRAQIFIDRETPGCEMGSSCIWVVEVMSVPRCITMFDGFVGYVVVRLQVKWQLWISDTSQESTKWQRNPSCCSCLEL